MTNRNAKYFILPFACLAGFATLAHGTDDAPFSMPLPALSRGQIQQALEQGVDLSKVNPSPGLHIVPLSKSWSTTEQANMQRQQIDQQRSRGFYSAEAGEVVDVRTAMRSAATQRGKIPRHDKAFHSMNEIRQDLAVDPVDLGSSALSSAHLLEIRFGGSHVNGKWTGVARSFEVAGLGLVILNETDHAAGKESVTLIQEWLNIEINGQPGTAKTARDGTGRTLVTVGWANQRKLYSLQLQPLHPESNEANQAKLLEIAHKLVEV